MEARRTSNLLSLTIRSISLHFDLDYYDYDYDYDYDTQTTEPFNLSKIRHNSCHDSGIYSVAATSAASSANTIANPLFLYQFKLYFLKRKEKKKAPRTLRDENRHD
jgi:hypothetical protein